MSFHVNPENGVVSTCKARNGKCPFGVGAIHAETKAEAQKEYEKVMKEKELTTAKRHLDKENSQDLTRYEPTTYYIVEANKEKAVKSIERANRRLEKAGIQNKFEYTIEEHTREEVKDGVLTAKKYYTIELNEPKISLAGYEFQATLNKEGKGFITRAARGVDLGGQRPESMVCEHCGHNRARSKTYLIKGPDGKTHQIGSACVQEYLGVKPEGLWALGFEPVEDDDVEEYFGGGGGASHLNVEQSLAIALAVSNNGEKYVPTSSYSGVPTSIQVSQIFSQSDKSKEGTAYRKKILRDAEVIAASGEVEKLIKKIKDLPSNNDYTVNLKTLVEEEYVNPKNTNMLVSAVSILGREKREAAYKAEAERREAEKLAKNSLWSKGHYLTPEAKIPKGTKFEVVESRLYHSTDYYGNDVMKTAVTMKDENNHQIIWFASKSMELEPGQSLEVSSGKVKKHQEKDGADQTIVSNIRLAK